jgi:hypothetical protein
MVRSLARTVPSPIATSLDGAFAHILASQGAKGSAASAASRFRPEVSKNSSTALSSNEGELARSITTCVPASFASTYWRLQLANHHSRILGWLRQDERSSHLFADDPKNDK